MTSSLSYNYSLKLEICGSGNHPTILPIDLPDVQTILDKQPTNKLYSAQKQIEIRTVETKKTTDTNQRCNSQINKSIPALARLCTLLKKASGHHSNSAMRAAGLEYTDNGDTAQCHSCGLEVSDLAPDMQPFTVHRQRSPTCPFVLSMLPPSIIKTLAINSPHSVPSPSLGVLAEVDSLKQVRKRIFSHWPHQSSPSATQMIQAGFFACNVGDRAICIYCNLICQQWTPGSDDPCEVHKTLSPNCPYVMFILSAPSSSPISIINEASASVDSFPSQAIVHTAACNPNYIEIPKRSASFAAWPNENLPSIDDLVKAGFFFTGTKTIVTCFYCNGSLQNWGANDNPMIEHARWFPQCAYARQLCGAELYRKIQESKRAQQEKANVNEASSPTGATVDSSSQGRLLIADETTLSRFVAARLDLPLSQSLLASGFKLSIIKRCWEDQLRLKHEDFASDSDLLMACTILKKQIECIGGKKENIAVPSVAMKKHREKELAEARAREQAASRSISTSGSERNDVKIIPSSSIVNTTRINTQGSTANNQDARNTKMPSARAAVQKSNEDGSPLNPCVLCLSEERSLACMPCGHLATCVPCGHSLRSCPMCRREIDAFIRIYI